MDNTNRYVVLSLELHLFFARIMKEHALFLEAGFTPANASFAKEADGFKIKFEELLMQAVRLANGLIRPKVLCSGEIVTEFTASVEQQTQQFTGIAIDSQITEMEENLRSVPNCPITREVFWHTKRLNETALRLVNGLISLKERVLNNVTNCCMFTLNYPLLIEHIIREAKLYRSYLLDLENGRLCDCRMRQTEQFWNRIMMEHALFIRGLLDPSEEDLIQTSHAFATEYACLLEKSRKANDCAMQELTRFSLEETLKFRDFKAAGAKGICNCEIRSIILPLLADHVLREANHYIRLLSK